eukprot:CAMPEP_0171118034 /NCGR_PEP_ID=MMETSP0766_2-20121228/93850_1 /TAXON_ID=439317 /ORGANISM="Gambierdiscus australes, Strain CAWD 149" /LENGTH=187 /DNA_ID=CAMNT_0011580587 /DNA_START=1 /DNA_END=563 /DNA_ORIENTATION=+
MGAKFAAPCAKARNRVKAKLVLCQLSAHLDDFQFEPHGAERYNMVISAAAKTGKTQAAEAGPDKAEFWFEKTKCADVRANRITYKTLMNAAARVGDAEAAERWFNQILEAGMTADAIAYTTMISTAKQRGDVHLAKTWLDAMIKSGVDPDEFTFGALIATAGMGGAGKGISGSHWRMWRCRLLEWTA